MHTHTHAQRERVVRAWFKIRGAVIGVDSLDAVSSKCRGNADLLPAGCRELDQLPSIC